MFATASLWIPFTVVAAAGQVARNAMQRQLTGPLGTWGATNIRFLFGFPFSLIFLAVVLLVSGDRLPWPTTAFWPWLLLGLLVLVALWLRQGPTQPQELLPPSAVVAKAGIRAASVRPDTRRAPRSARPCRRPRWRDAPSTLRRRRARRRRARRYGW